MAGSLAHSQRRAVSAGLAVRTPVPPTFTETLSVDLAGTGVHVTQLCPGPVPTELEETAGNFTGQSPPKLVEVTAAHCARVALRALDANRAMVIPGFLINIAMLLSKYTPRWLVRALARPLGRALRKKQLAVLGA